jgi:hypothetical protein
MKKPNFSLGQLNSLTDWNMTTRQKMSFVTAPASHRPVTEHLGFGSRFRSDNFRVADVNVSNVPGERLFLHRRIWLRLNGRKSIYGAAETVGPIFGAGSVVPDTGIEQRARGSGKGRLSTPNRKFLFF